MRGTSQSLCLPVFVMLVLCSACSPDEAEPRPDEETEAGVEEAEESLRADSQPVPQAGDIGSDQLDLAMTARYQDRVITAPQVGQAAAIVTFFDGDEPVREERVPAALYAGAPFSPGLAIRGIPIGTIEMDYQRFYLPNERIIEIEEADRFLLLPSADSEVPFWIRSSNGEITMDALVRAANVTWVFKHAGMRFETLSHLYVTEKPEAKIFFRRDGVDFDGITVMEKTNED